MPLIEILRGARVLLVDFDGPLCAVFAGYPAATIAERLHSLIGGRLGGELPSTIAAAGADPLQTVRAVAALDNGPLTRVVAEACRDAEIAAVATATPTPGAGQFLRAAQSSGRPVVVVSNNAAEAVVAYLNARSLSGLVESVVARTAGMDPRLLKPDPFLLRQALRASRVEPGEAVFVGDSVTDVEAGRAVSVTTVGYANKSGKDRWLRAAGAAVVIDSMSELTNAVQKVTARGK